MRQSPMLLPTIRFMVLLLFCTCVHLFNKYLVTPSISMNQALCWVTETELHSAPLPPFSEPHHPAVCRQDGSAHNPQRSWFFWGHRFLGRFLFLKYLLLLCCTFRWQKKVTLVQSPCMVSYCLLQCIQGCHFWNSVDQENCALKCVSINYISFLILMFPLKRKVV